MKLERIISPLGISELIKVQDNGIEKKFFCSKGEWIQWLISIIEKQEIIGVWAVREEEGKPIKGYVVGINSIAPPISNSVMLLYSSICYANSEDANRLAVEAIVNWGRTLGAREVALFTDHPDLSSKYGFKRIDGIPMVLKIKEENE